MWNKNVKRICIVLLSNYGNVFRKCDGDRSSIITRLLDEAKKLNLAQRKSRSLLEEFLQPDSKCNCGLLQVSIWLLFLVQENVVLTKFFFSFARYSGVGTRAGIVNNKYLYPLGYENQV